MNKILFSMVTTVNKWLSVSAFVLLTGFMGHYETVAGKAPPIPSIEGNAHPLHISTTEINHNATGKTLEISCRIFIDDFESCLSKQYHTKADLSAANVKTAMDTLVKKYINSHLQIKADGKSALINYIGFEKEADAAYVYFEAENIVSLKKIEISDSILFDLYDDQISIIHVIVAGNRKSTKLDYPNKEAVFNF